MLYSWSWKRIQFTDKVLSKDLDNEIMQLFINYILNIDLKKVKPSMIDQSNIINKNLLLNLPEVNTTKELIKYINTGTNDFYSNEDLLRKRLNIEDNEIRKEEAQIKDQFIRKEKQLVDNVYYEIQKKLLFYS